MMKKFAQLIVALTVVVALGVVAPQSADAGLFGRHHAGKSACCAPEPVCAPAPVCAPEPVCAPQPVCPPVCAPAPVCAPVCPLPPVKVSWCVTDPCTCCTYQVSACVPAECACETPCLASSRSGFLGRKILTYKWPGCDHCVEVVITKHGKTIVRA